MDSDSLPMNISPFEDGYEVHGKAIGLEVESIKKLLIERRGLVLEQGWLVGKSERSNNKMDNNILN